MIKARDVQISRIGTMQHIKEVSYHLELDKEGAARLPSSLEGIELLVECEINKVFSEIRIAFRDLNRKRNSDLIQAHSEEDINTINREYTRNLQKLEGISNTLKGANAFGYTISNPFGDLPKDVVDHNRFKEKLRSVPLPTPEIHVPEPAIIHSELSPNNYMYQ